MFSFSSSIYILLFDFSQILEIGDHRHFGSRAFVCVTSSRTAKLAESQGRFITAPDETLEASQKEMSELMTRRREP